MKLYTLTYNCLDGSFGSIVFANEPTRENLEDSLYTEFSNEDYENLILGEVVDKGDSFYLLETHYL